jgi:hypothetical protein
MARGAAAKEEIVNRLLSTFEGAFKFDKEIRIPMMENGEEVQIKVTLTCAKVNVDRGSDTALPGVLQTKDKPTVGSISNATDSSLIEPTAEEKANVKALMERLGL